MPPRPYTHRLNLAEISPKMPAPRLAGVYPIGTAHLRACQATPELSDYSGVRLTGRIAGFFEEVPAFVGAEQGADVAQGGPERLEGARGRLAQERFDLGERHLDGVQIG